MSMWTRGPQSQQRVAMGDYIVGRPPAGGSTSPAAITNESANRNSAVWACRRLRADLISTFPCDQFRKVDRINVEIPAKPPILVEPGGKHWDYMDWMWASQFDLDGTGNAIGLITEVNALGLPARIDLQPIGRCSVFQRKDMPEHKYRIDGKEYAANKVWHERQYPVAGLPIGLSPIAFAAWTIAEGLSMQQFALDWYGGGAATPKVTLKNTKRSLDQGGTTNEARRVKDRYKATMATGDVFVTGNDWELDFQQAEAVGKEWIDGRSAGLADICRWMGCPADVIDAMVSGGGAITYASITQRNLQLLIMNLGPAVMRREKNLTKLLPRPRFVKLNTDALLRLDPQARDAAINARIAARTLTNTEARELYNQEPLSDAQIAEFERIYGPVKVAAQPAAARHGGWWDPVNAVSSIPYADTIYVEPEGAER